MLVIQKLPKSIVGRTKCRCGPHVDRGPRVWDPWTRWYNSLGTSYLSWKCWVRFQVGHTEGLKMVLVACPASCLALMRRVQGNGSRAVLPLTRHQFSVSLFTAIIRVSLFNTKPAAWPTTQASGDGRCRPLVTVRKEHKNEYNWTFIGLPSHDKLVPFNLIKNLFPSQIVIRQTSG